MSRHKKEVERSVLEMARERVSIAYNRFDHIAVSFSGGKDSTVCLHLALEEAERRKRLPLDVVFFDEEAIHPPTIEYVERVAANPKISLRWYCVPIKHRNACSKKQPYWNTWAPEDEAKWCRCFPRLGRKELPVPGFARQPMPECNRFLYPRDLGQVGIIVGIRADESLRRYMSVTHRTYDNFIAVDPDAQHCSLVKPIYDWVTDDVWAAALHFGWDYNRSYDVFTAAGVARPIQRVCPPYGEEPLQGLRLYATCFPELWERMVSRVPGAATAARYSRSPLYGFGSLTQKPEGRTWQEHIRREIQKWPEKYRAGIASRIKSEIAGHNRVSKDPIPETKKHPISGISWRWLFMISVRGDLKRRKLRPMSGREEMEAHGEAEAEVGRY